MPARRTTTDQAQSAATSTGDGAIATHPPFQRVADLQALAGLRDQTVDEARQPGATSVGNFRFDEPRQMFERLLPAEIAELRRDRLRNPLLHDVQLRPAGHGAQGDGRDHLAWQVRVVELVGVTDALVGHELQIVAAEGKSSRAIPMA